MAIGKISYNGGSGVKGAGTDTYIIHADSEPIKAGNFVEKVEVLEPSNDNAMNIVLETIQLNEYPQISQISLINNRLLIACSDNSRILLKLYDTTKSATPVLLDEVIIANSGTTSLNLIKISDNISGLAFGNQSLVNVVLMSTINDVIKMGVIESAFVYNSNIIKLELFNSNKLGIFAKDTSNNIRIVAFTINQDLTLSNESNIYTIEGVNSNSHLSCVSIGNNRIILIINQSAYSGQLVVHNISFDPTYNRIDIHTTSTISNSSTLPTSTLLVATNKVLIVYQPNQSSINAVFANISANAISISGVNLLKTNIPSGGVTSLNLVKYNDEKYAIIYNGKINLLTINNNVVSVGDDQTLSSMGNNVSVTSPIPNRICVLYKNTNNYPNLSQCGVSGNIINDNVPIYKPHDEIIKAVSKIDGVAKKSGVTGDEIVIYTLGGNE